MELYFIASGQGYSPSKKITASDGTITEQAENFNSIRNIYVWDNLMMTNL